MRSKGIKQTQLSIDRRNMVAGACLRKLCKAQLPSVAGLLGCPAALTSSSGNVTSTVSIETWDPVEGP